MTNERHHFVQSPRKSWVSALVVPSIEWDLGNWRCSFQRVCFASSILWVIISLGRTTKSELNLKDARLQGTMILLESFFKKKKKAIKSVDCCCPHVSVVRLGCHSNNCVFGFVKLVEFSERTQVAGFKVVRRTGYH